MRQFILCTLGVIALLMACSSPQRGDDPVRRDSVGDPIDPRDTTVERLDPDSVTEEPELSF